jgi:Protein of unknown function (DUF1800)
MQTGRTNWVNDLTPLHPREWTRDCAAHLLERAGFGGTPEEIDTLTAMTLQQAVRHLVRFEGADGGRRPFEGSDIFDEGLNPFPASRPEVTRQAKAEGAALGIKVKPGGDRPAQSVVNKFFYWLRASRLETDRLAYWWANRMLCSQRPLQEKMALFWHGHFATNEDKVRDCRKMHKQLQLFQEKGTGEFRELLIGVAQDPAMLAFLDAGVNVKGKPNENFAREIMELFTMGVGHYSERDIREAARAFTGWNFNDLTFEVDPGKHDQGEKTVLGEIGNFDGVAVIDIILHQTATAEFLAQKIYRFFVRDEIAPSVRTQLGARFRDSGYDITGLLETIFLSKDFYSIPSAATHIKGPVELVVSTYKRLGLKEIPGIPDFNEVTGSLGQQLFHPPTVAGWAQGKSWITPGLLIERGNFALDALFVDVNFIPRDRYAGGEIGTVHERIRAGYDISAATKPLDKKAAGTMAESNEMADRDEDFNTHYGSYRGWQMAVERVKPIPRAAARVNLTSMVIDAQCQTSADAVHYLERRFLLTPMSESSRKSFETFLTRELATDRLTDAQSYAEDPLRMLAHLIMSLPEYQLG